MYMCACFNAHACVLDLESLKVFVCMCVHTHACTYPYVNVQYEECIAQVHACMCTDGGLTLCVRVSVSMCQSWCACLNASMHIYVYV